METFQKQLHLPVTRIDDSKRMLALLKVPYNSLICIHRKCSSMHICIMSQSWCLPCWLCSRCLYTS